MGYIEDYFHKEITSIQEIDIQHLIEQQIQENLTLDYKDFQKYDDPLGLSQHISAFANSMGGLIILGISERENFPNEITWGNLRGKTRESLENRLVSKIYPKIEGIRIIPVYKTGSTEEGIFLIDIPQGNNPPYMAGDNKYYKRLNFQKQPMEGYEVADFFSRRKRPKLSIVLDHVKLNSLIENQVTIVWNVFVKNVGKAVVKEFFCRIRSSDASILSVSPPFQTERDPESRISAKGIFADPQKYILLPHPTEELFLGIIDFGVPLPPPFFDRDKKISVEYELLAENMPIVKGSFKFSLKFRGKNAFVEIILPVEEEISQW